MWRFNLILRISCVLILIPACVTICEDADCDQDEYDYYENAESYESDENSEKEGVLSLAPMKQNLFINRVYCYNCTINSGNSTSKDIEFHYNGKKVNETVIGEKQKEICIMETEPGMTNLYCLTNDSCCEPGLSPHFGRKPDVPIIESCVILNWDELICQVKDTANHTTKNTYAIKYQVITRQRDEAAYKILTNKGENVSFDYFPKEFHSDETDVVATDGSLCLLVIASNTLDHTQSMPYCYTGRDIVKPSPVKNFNVTDSSVRNMLLSWTKPKKNTTHKLMYLIETSCDITQTKKNYTVRSTEDRIVYPLNDIHPGCDYEISIRVKPADADLYSDRTATVFRTRDDVPGELPTLAQGYREHTTWGATRSVTVYFQPVKARQQHGVISYKVEWKADVTTVKHPGGPVVNHANISGDVISYMIESLRRSQNYTVSVMGFTSAGFNQSLVPRKLNIPAVPDKVDSFVDIEVLRLNDTDMIRWFNPSLTDTLFVSCAVRDLDADCKYNLHWRVVPAGVKNITMTPPGQGQVKYAVSTWSPTASILSNNMSELSPIRGYKLSWWDECLFSSHHAPGAPTVEIVSFNWHYMTFEVTAAFCDREMSSGMTLYYMIYVCEGNPEHCNQSNPGVRIINATKSGRSTHNTVDGLTAAQDYKVTAVSVSYLNNKRSQQSLPVHVKTKGARTWVLVVCGLVAVLVFIIMVTGIKWIYKRCRQYWKKELNVEHIYPEDIKTIDSHNYVYTNGNLGSVTTESNNPLLDTVTTTQTSAGSSDVEMSAYKTVGVGESRQSLISEESEEEFDSGPCENESSMTLDTTGGRMSNRHDSNSDDDYARTTDKEADNSGPDPETAGSIHSINAIEPYPDDLPSNVNSMPSTFSATTSNQSSAMEVSIDVSDYPHLSAPVDVSDYQTSPQSNKDRVETVSQSDNSSCDPSLEDLHDNDSIENSRNNPDPDYTSQLSTVLNIPESDVDSLSDDGELDDNTSNISLQNSAQSDPSSPQGESVENISIHVQDYPPVISDQPSHYTVPFVELPSSEIAPETDASNVDIPKVIVQPKNGYHLTDKCQTGIPS